MPQATRDIKRRIKSISNIKKVTKAMEMVAAAKMRQATGAVLSSRSYADLAWKLVRRLAAKTASEFHPLLQDKERIEKVGLVLITSNKGLCGGFNTQIIQRAVRYIKKQLSQNVSVALVVMGKKGRDFMLKRDYSIVADFDKADVAVDVLEIRPLVKLLIGDYLAGKLDKVALAYTDFISTLVQQPRIIELLPLNREGGDENLGEVESRKSSFALRATEDRSASAFATEDRQESPPSLYELRRTGKQDGVVMEFEYLFEPSPDEVLSDLLPRLLEMQIYQAILESNASEHSARMVAMRNASDAALEMIDDLTLVFNKARQAAITAELADISGGRAAVE